MLDLIVDIQSSVVRGSLMMTRPGALPHILWTKSLEIKYRPHAGSTYLIKMATRAVEEIAGEAHTYVIDGHGRAEVLPRISVVHCVLASPWAVSRARTVSQEFSRETKITRGMIADIIKAERVSLASGDENGLASIEEKIFDVRLNGYSIPGWEGNGAKHLEVSFALSLAGSRMIERFTAAAQHANPHAKVRFHSSLLLQHAGVKIALPGMDSYMLIHAHGELTDIVIINAHSCVFFGSHPVGVRTIIRKLAHTLKISDAAADSMISLADTGALDSASDVAHARTLGQIGHAWTTACTKLISVAPPGCMPSQAVISSRLHEPFFSSNFTRAYPSIAIRPLSSESIFSLVSCDPSTEKLRLTALYAVAIHSLEAL